MDAESSLLTSPSSEVVYTPPANQSSPINAVRPPGSIIWGHGPRGDPTRDRRSTSRATSHAGSRQVPLYAEVLAAQTQTQIPLKVACRPDFSDLLIGERRMETIEMPSVDPIAHYLAIWRYRRQSRASHLSTLEARSPYGQTVGFRLNIW